MIDPMMPTRLRPSCNVPGRGIAMPPRRIVRTAQVLEASGAQTIVESICQSGYAGAVSGILDALAERVTPPVCED